MSSNEWTVYRHRWTPLPERSRRHSYYVAWLPQVSPVVAPILRNLEPMKRLFFDLEIIKLIKPDPRYPLMAVCGGWDDFDNMGISCVGYAVEDQEPIAEGWLCGDFVAMALSGDYQLIGFNSHNFDDRLLAANGVKRQSLDLLAMVRLAAYGSKSWQDQPEGYSYKLDALAEANLINFRKTGHGALAPLLWQLGRQQEVCDYCANDVKILQALWFKFHGEGLIDPNNGRLLHQEQSWV